jgi:glycosyltransferase involved in cell wall biosynthesis
MTDKHFHPLVSIIVITYNSAEFVTETLESIKTQDYQNIELIVSDDNSSDTTVTICQKWISENKSRFVNTCLVTTEINYGIPANINRGVKVSSGEWIKCLAGDDLLTETCISEMIQFISAGNGNIQIVSSNVIKFTGNSIKNGVVTKNPNSRFCSVESSAKDQYEMLLRFNRVFAATVITKKDLLISMNGYDERYKLLEDWPMWLKITSAGHKIYHLDKALVLYRLHDNNLSQTTSQKYLYHPVNKIVIKFKENELLPRLPFIEKWGLKHDILGIKTCFWLGNNKRNPFTRIVYSFFIITNPNINYLRIRKLFGRKNKYL